MKGYSVTESLEASVQPLTAEQASLAGLQTDRETYNVFIRPARDVSPDDRVEMRGKQWRVYASEAWQNYTLVKVEPL